MRWQPASPMTETLLQESAQALLPQKQMLLDHNVILAIETHFEWKDAVVALYFIVKYRLMN